MTNNPTIDGVSREEPYKPPYMEYIAMKTNVKAIAVGLQLEIWKSSEHDAYVANAKAEGFDEAYAICVEVDGTDFKFRTVADFTAALKTGSESVDQLAPPAPVAAALPENLLSHRGSWLCAMDRLIELEPISHAPDSDQRGFWEHERKAMHDMYACLDATAELNEGSK